MDAVKLSPERNIEIIYKKVLNNTIVLMSDFLGDSISEKTKNNILNQFSERLQLINKTYWVAKEKFKYTKRESWEKYFSHVSWVLNIYLEKLSTVKASLEKLDNTKKEDIKKALELIKNEVTIAATCLDHDSIEDTDVTYEWLKETSGKMVAFTTLLLSKNPFNKYIDNEDDLKEFQEIKKIWILNSKWLLSDEMKTKIHIEENIYDELEKFSITDNYEITKEERDWISRYIILEKKYKEIRNNHYFEHIKSREAIEEYAKQLMEEKSINFSKEDFDTIIQNVILVKLADRIQNLEDIATSWAKKPEKIEKKLIETEKYLLPLAKEVNEEVYNYMKSEIYRIRETMTKVNINNKIDNALLEKV